MADPIVTPMLIGAGVGALGGLVTGKDPLTGAALGAALGGTGGASGLFGGATAASGAGAGLATGAGSAAAGTGIALGDVAASTALPTALQGSSLATGIGAGTTGGVAGGAGIGLSQGASNIAYGFNPVAEGVGMGSIDNLGQYATGTGYDLMANQPSMFDKISPYLNVQNLNGASQIASQFQPRPQPTPQSGRVSEGRAPQGTDVMSLLQSIKQPERRRISLV